MTTRREMTKEELAEAVKVHEAGHAWNKYTQDDLLAHIAALEARAEKADAKAKYNEEVIEQRNAMLKRATSVARDAALEEVMQASRGAFPKCEADLFCDMVVTLKSQPARRFVDADELVAKVRRLKDTTPCAGYPVALKAFRLLLAEFNISASEIES
jgi:hypothetical protein